MQCRPLTPRPLKKNNSSQSWAHRSCLWNIARGTLSTVRNSWYFGETTNWKGLDIDRFYECDGEFMLISFAPTMTDRGGYVLTLIGAWNNFYCILYCQQTKGCELWTRIATHWPQHSHITSIYKDEKLPYGFNREAPTLAHSSPTMNLLELPSSFS